MDKADLNYNNICNYKHTAFILACQNQADEVALKLLEISDLNYNQINKDGDNAFMLACLNGMTEVVEKLIKIIWDLLLL